ncbi:uncharacterized protein LOC106175818 [Lingula anatina]|uniref:Uncharacterized protein LOC106175818 n=1 Tax=Lingula anatina TaxID=7574 RepID=A0A1S3JTI9_LINAN|nr:uncharacterized protein LOC106175818 [Lingula anatina]|eukprot:XP_013413426.1 uncharacterized protein LOC106175818 [Lingula anatina]
MSILLQIEQLNFFKLSTAVLDYVNEALRFFFVEEWNSLYAAGGYPWGNNVASGQYLLAEEFRLYPTARLFDRDMAHVRALIGTGIVEDWDATALFAAILYSKVLDLRRSRGYRSKLRRVTPFSEAEHVDELRLVRNFAIAHANTASVTDVTYQAHMQTVLDALSALLPPTHPVLQNMLVLMSSKTFNTSELEFLQEELANEKEITEKIEKQHKRILENANEIKSMHARIQQLEMYISRDKSKPAEAIYTMFQSEPDFKGDTYYNDMINTTNKLTYGFDFKKFRKYVTDQLNLVKDTDMKLLIRIQLCKGLNHQGQKDEALGILDKMTVEALSAKNSAVIQARVFWRKAYIYNDRGYKEGAIALLEQAECLLTTTQSYEDIAEINYAKANIRLSQKHDNNDVSLKSSVLRHLGKTLEACKQCPGIDLSTLESQVALRKALTHLGFSQQGIDQHSSEEDLHAAEGIVNELLKNKDKLSPRNNLYLYFARSLLAYRRGKVMEARRIELEGRHFAATNHLPHEVQQLEMIKDFILKNERWRIFHKLIIVVILLICVAACIMCYCHYVKFEGEKVSGKVLCQRGSHGLLGKPKDGRFYCYV